MTTKEETLITITNSKELAWTIVCSKFDLDLDALDRFDVIRVLNAIVELQGVMNFDN